MTLPATIKAGFPAVVVPLIEEQTRSIYGADGQFERAEFDGVRVKPGGSVDDLRRALAEVERSMQPCGSGQRAIDALAPMFATRRNRPGDQADEQASIVVYGARFREFPFVVIQQAGAHFIDTSPWLPAISELLPVLDRLMRPLRALKTALELAIARASTPVRPQIEAPQRPKTQHEAISQLIALRKQRGDIAGAAVREAQLAKIEDRPIEAWAAEILAAKRVEEDAARAEFQRMADEAKAATATTPPRSADTLRAVARHHRDQGNEERATQLERQADAMSPQVSPSVAR